MRRLWMIVAALLLCLPMVGSGQSIRVESGGGLPVVSSPALYVVGSGPGTLTSNTDGTQNVGFGTDCLKLNTTGTHNVAFGAYSLASNVSNSGNAAFGTNALKMATADYNTAFGTQALAANTTGSSNVGIGYNAAAKITEGSSNVVIGVNALTNAATTTGGNVVVGTTAAYNGTGDNNTVVGKEAGYRSGAVQDPGNAITSGSGLTFIGYRSGFGSASQRTNATAIGFEAYVDADNTVVLGDENVTSVLASSDGGATVTAGAFKVGSNTGISGTVVVKGSDGNNCNLVFEGGIVTSETCP